MPHVCVSENSNFFKLFWFGIIDYFHEQRIIFFRTIYKFAPKTKKIDDWLMFLTPTFTRSLSTVHRCFQIITNKITGSLKTVTVVLKILLV